MNKQAIRKAFSEKRKKLSPADIHAASEAMMRHFAMLDLHNVATVLSYLPIERFREFDPSGCEQLLSAAPYHARIAHPRILTASSSMEAVGVDMQTVFVDNEYLIREPAQGDILTPESIDAVLVPLLAFDLRGFRVGYGKGFYDRWLAQCRPDVVKIGFSFFDPVEAIGDINEFDVPLSYCITPTRVYEF